MVKRTLLFKTLQKINIQNLLLQNIIEVHKNTETQIKVNNRLSYTKQMNKGFGQGCPVCPNLFNVYISEIK